MTQCTLLTLNLRGARKPGTMARLIHAFKRMGDTHGLSVLCAQEHNLDPATAPELTRMATSKNMTLTVGFAPPAPDGVHRGGTFILSNNKTLTHKQTILQSKDLTICELDWGGETQQGGRTLRIASVYAPVKPLARVNFFQTIHHHLTDETIVGGDWNCVTDVTTDVISSNPLAYRNIGHALLAQRLGSLGLQDERRDQLNGKTEITRIGSSRNGYIGTCLDRWYVPSTHDFDNILWSFDITNTFIFKNTPSDHLGVMLTIDAQQGEMGHDRRTIREDLVMEWEVQKSILAILKQSYRGHGTNTHKWETAMTAIKEYLMKETTLRQKRDSVKIKQKLAMLDIIAKRLKSSIPSHNYIQLQHKLQQEVYEIRFPEAKALPTNDSALNMHQRSDSCTKQQFQPYKNQAQKAWVNTVKVTDWQEDVDPVFTSSTSHTSKVAAEFGKYYKMLYGPKKTDAGCAKLLLRAFRKNKILACSAERMNRDITKKEVAEVMENLPIGKQAGPNRIPNAVFKYMSKHFAPKLANVLNESASKGKLPPHFLQGDISVLHKKDDRADPRNYRPITLLNTDYKIFTRILAKRMREVVHEFTSESQKGFVPHTFISESSTLLSLIESYINEEPLDRKGLLLFLDMEKAFDRVSYDFTIQGLQAIGFNGKFMKWIKMMYDEQKAPQRRIYVNGYYSDWFHIKSGVAQGCPVSPLLFLVVAEALRNSILMEPKLKGIKIHDTNYLISQFADDTTLMLGHKNEIKYANRALKRWCKATGMRENATKREGIKMGKYRYQDLPSPGVTWKNGIESKTERG